MKRFLIVVSFVLVASGCSLFESDSGGDSSGGGGETETTLVEE